MIEGSHSVPPIENLVFVASYLEALPFLLVFDQGDIGEPFLSCREVEIFNID